MAKRIDPFVIQWPRAWMGDPEIRPVIEYLNRYLHDLNLALTSGTGVVTSRTFQTEVTADYVTTGNFDHEIVVCNNTVDITITLQSLTSDAQVSVTRAGTGGVTIDGNGATIIGESTQEMPDQYDVANLTGSSVEWVLKS